MVLFLMAQFGHIIRVSLGISKSGRFSSAQIWYCVVLDRIQGAMMTRLARLLAGEVEMCSGFFTEEICFLFTCLVCAVVVVVATSACWDMRQQNIGGFLSGKFLTYADDK